jgi:hypothetical protein
MINICFSPVLSSNCIHIYMDDVLIAGDDPKELEKWTYATLDIMCKSKLLCKPVKAQFK